MAGSTKKRKSANADFKRIKAKVGKKAVKLANVTDTSFKSASVSVRSQVVDFTSQGKLLSERGRSIQELVTQLNHPAAVVRTSAVRGLSNVVESHSEFLKAHFSMLLPAVAKCCVDENDSVRQLGLEVLRNVLTTDNQSALRPFLTLLTAYASSALNSLDRTTRLDGGRAVEILSTTLPSLMGSQAEMLLPAFVGLLSDYTEQRRPAESSKKHKKTDDSGANGQFPILMSLVALLRAVSETNHDNKRQNFVAEKPDLVFVPGGRSVNALLIAGREHRSVRPLQSINELPPFMEGALSGTKSEKESSLSVGVATDILSKFRDILIELSQRCTTAKRSRGGILLETMDIEELSLLNEAIRLFWNAFCGDMIRQASNPKHVEGLRRVFITMMSLMMDSFPVWPQSASSDFATKCEQLNADICATLIDIGGYVESDSKGLSWTKNVLDYLLPRLDSDALIPRQGGTVVDVLSRLLLLKHDSIEFTLAEKTRCKILDRICGVFFADELKPDVARLASSRRAVLLVVAILRHENYQIVNDGSFSAHLKAAAKALPLYLLAWRGDFLPESSAVLSALHNVSRRLDMASHASEDLLEYLRNGLNLIFEAPKRSKRQKRSQTTLISPIFELYSQEMQRLALGFLVMTRSLSETTINGLSYMCARSGSDATAGGGVVTPAIADAILSAVNSIRRTMSMQAYLSFIISSIGIANFEAKLKTKRGEDSRKDAVVSPKGKGCKSSAATCTDLEAVSEDREEQPAEVQFSLEVVRASEAPVLRAARSFALCGSAKVLSMIDPVLTEWLAAMCPTSGLDPTQRAIRFRAASSICTILVLDTLSSSVGAVTEDDSLPTSIFVMAPDLARNLVTASCDVFAFCFSRGSNTHELVNVLDYLMQPLLVSAFGVILILLATH